MQAGIRDGRQVQPLSICTAHNHGKGIFKPQAARDGNVEATCIERADRGKDRGGGPFLRQRLFEDGSQRGAGVLNIRVNATCDERLMAEVAAGKIEAAVHFFMAFCLNLLRKKFTQNDLLCEVFGADGNP